MENSGSNEVVKDWWGFIEGLDRDVPTPELLIVGREMLSALPSFQNRWEM